MKFFGVRPRHRADNPRAPRTRAVSAVASIAAGSLLVSAGVTSSAASFTDTEMVRGEAGALNCAAPSGVVDAHAWGRILTAELLEFDLDPLAFTDGITVENVAPATTSAGRSNAGTADYLGDDAWEAALDLGLLSLIPLGVGLTLPLDTGTGVYSQYGRASSNGTMIGAAGAVTSQAGGLVSLDQPSADTPRVGELQLSDLVDSVLPGLGSAVGGLITDVSLDIGAVGAVAEFDGCEALWDGAAAAHLDRDYLVADVDLLVDSPLVQTIGTTISGTLDELETGINALLNSPLEGDALAAVTGLLDTVLGGLAGIGLGQNPLTVQIGGSIDLQPVRDLLDDDISDGVVTINLSDGSIRADLAALVGEAYQDGSGLNGRDPNTSILTPEVINALLARVSTMLDRFVVEQIEPKILELLYGVNLDVLIAADVTLSVLGYELLNVARLTVDLDLSVGRLLGQTGYPDNGVDIDIALLDGSILSFLLAPLNLLISSLLTGLLDPIVSTLIPGLADAVLLPLLGVVTSLVSGVVADLVGTALPPLVEALRPVFDLLESVVKLTLNAQPDQPGTVGAPVSAPRLGEYFVSALNVKVIGAAEAAVLDLYLANASVGPARAR
ncbi:choice-of-anchor G family protein [Salinibacterium sp. ZJ77]|uniref:choice-of-anchor G family protein n=1 Tax=Salinibacterium sp. ZJ77 TaxID=2708337 RepID=UPI0014236465|nr:choice-of-anchor G family protein [Salinibacterium sp. ZJ77]